MDDGKGLGKRVLIHNSSKVEPRPWYQLSSSFLTKFPHLCQTTLVAQFPLIYLMDKRFCCVKIDTNIMQPAAIENISVLLSIIILCFE